MSTILGVWNGNDAGAALVRDGVVLAAAGEERFNREKLTRSFPKSAIEFVLKHSQIEISEIDRVASGAWSETVGKGTLLAVIQDIEKILDTENLDGLVNSLRRIISSAQGDVEARKTLNDGLDDLDLGQMPLDLVNHHLSHAVTAFAPSPFVESLVLVVDGRGDFRSTSLWHASVDSGYRLVHEMSELSSLGILYGVITRLLGFVPDRHEGKVMGLAARGI